MTRCTHRRMRCARAPSLAATPPGRRTAEEVAGGPTQSAAPISTCHAGLCAAARARAGQRRAVVLGDDDIHGVRGGRRAAAHPRCVSEQTSMIFCAAPAARAVRWLLCPRHARCAAAASRQRRVRRPAARGRSGAAPRVACSLLTRRRPSRVAAAIFFVFVAVKSFVGARAAAPRAHAPVPKRGSGGWASRASDTLAARCFPAPRRLVLFRPWLRRPLLPRQRAHPVRCGPAAAPPPVTRSMAGHALNALAAAVSVLIHELAHCAVARHYGEEIKHISLWCVAARAGAAGCCAAAGAALCCC